MPLTSQIENADALTASQAVRLIAAIRASEVFRENRAAYPDLADKIMGERVERKFTVTGATNTAPIVITAASDLQNDEFVTVRSVQGNTAANGTWLVANIDVDTETFQLWGSTGNGVYTSGGEVLDLISQHLSAIVDALDAIGDGTVGLKGGRDGVDYSQVRDREALIAEALNAIYDVEDAGAIVAVGQRNYADRLCTTCGGYVVGGQHICYAVGY